LTSSFFHRYNSFWLLGVNVKNYWSNVLKHPWLLHNLGLFSFFAIDCQYLGITQVVDWLVKIENLVNFIVILFWRQRLWEFTTFNFITCLKYLILYFSCFGFNWLLIAFLPLNFLYLRNVLRHKILFSSFRILSSK